MKTRIGSDGTLETEYNDADIERTYPAQPTPENTGNAGYSPAILKMVKKMRKGSIADNNERSQKICKALNEERKKMDRRKNRAKKTAELPVKPLQCSISDF